MTHIKNLIFDLGDVLINIDFKKVAQAFQHLGIADFEEQYSQLQASSLFEHLETGLISPSEFYTSIRNQGYPHLTDRDIQNAWNSILLDFRKDSLAYLTQLQPSYRLFLLSNTNAIHLEKIKDILFNQTGIGDLDHYFEKTYYSHLIGKRKPAKATYEFVLHDAHLNAHETFFIDDSLPNIEAASELGIQTHWLRPGEKIEGLNAIKLNK